MPDPNISTNILKFLNLWLLLQTKYSYSTTSFETDFFCKYGGGTIMGCSYLLKKVRIEIHNLIFFVQSLCDATVELTYTKVYDTIIFNFTKSENPIYEWYMYSNIYIW